jgi:hypothetical protein
MPTVVRADPPLPILPRTQMRRPGSGAAMVIATSLVLVLLGVAAGVACYVFVPPLFPEPPAPVAMSEGNWTADAPKAEPKRETPPPPPAPVQAKKDEPPAIPTLAFESLPVAPATKGSLVFAPGVAGHRVWLDGAPIATTAPLEVSCGKHSLRVGSSGSIRWINVPCGAQLAIDK